MWNDDTLVPIATREGLDWTFVTCITSLPVKKVLVKSCEELAVQYELHTGDIFHDAVHQRCTTFLPHLDSGEAFICVVIGSRNGVKLVVGQEEEGGPSANGKFTPGVGVDTPGASGSGQTPSPSAKAAMGGDAKPGPSTSSADGAKAGPTLAKEAAASAGPAAPKHAAPGTSADPGPSPAPGPSADSESAAPGPRAASGGTTAPPAEETTECKPVIGPVQFPEAWGAAPCALPSAVAIPEGYTLLDAKEDCGQFAVTTFFEHCWHAGARTNLWEIAYGMIGDFFLLLRHGTQIAAVGPVAIFLVILVAFTGAVRVPPRILAASANAAVGAFFRAVIQACCRLGFMPRALFRGQACSQVEHLLPLMACCGHVPCTVIVRDASTGENEVKAFVVAPPSGVQLSDCFLYIDVTRQAGRPEAPAHCGLIVPNDSPLVNRPVSVEYLLGNEYSMFGGTVAATPGARHVPICPCGMLHFDTAAMTIADSAMREAHGVTAVTWCKVISAVRHPTRCRAGERMGFGHHHPSLVYDTLRNCRCARVACGQSYTRQSEVSGMSTPNKLSPSARAILLALPPADPATVASSTANLVFFHCVAKKLPMVSADTVLAIHACRMADATAIEANGEATGVTYAAMPVGGQSLRFSDVLGYRQVNGRARTRLCQECGRMGANRHGLCNAHFKLTHCRCGRNLFKDYGCACATPSLAASRTAAHDAHVRSIVENYMEGRRVIPANSTVLVPCLHLPAVLGYGRKVENAATNGKVKLIVDPSQRKIKPPLGARLLGIAFDPCLPVVLYANLRAYISTVITRVAPEKPAPSNDARRAFLLGRFEEWVRVKSRMAPKNHDRMPYVGTTKWVEEVVKPTIRHCGFPRAKAEKYIQAAYSLRDMTFFKKKDFVTTGMFKYEKAAKFAGLHDLGGVAEDPPAAYRPVVSDAEMAATSDGRQAIDSSVMMASNGNPGDEFRPINYCWSARMIEYYKSGVVGAVSLAIVHSEMAWMKKHYSHESSWLGRKGAFIYGGGKDALKTGAMVARWATEFACFLCEGDFSKYDSYQDGKLLTCEMDARKVVHPGLWSHSICRQVLKEMRKGYRTVIRGVLSFVGEAKRNSGDYHTSEGNSENNLNFNGFAHFQAQCERAGAMSMPITPSTVRMMNSRDGFGLIFNGDDHVLRTTYLPIISSLREVLRDMGMVVVHKRPVPNYQLAKVGFLGGFICRATEVDERTGVRRACHIIVPDLTRFLSSYCWQLDPMDTTEWRVSVYRGWEALLGSMPVYGDLLRKIVTPEELRGCRSRDAHLTAEDRYKSHKTLSPGVSIVPDSLTHEDFAHRFAESNMGKWWCDLAWFRGMLVAVPPARPSVVRCEVMDGWLRSARN